MSKILIYRRGLNRAELDGLLKLLKEAGASANLEFLEDIPPAEEECGDEVVVFLLTRAVIEGGAFDDQIAKVPDGGRRAICIWPADATDAPLPGAAAKFSYSIVSWNAERLRIALADDDSTCFETPSGEPLEAPDTERNECE